MLLRMKKRAGRLLLKSQKLTAPYSLTYEGVWLQGDAPKEILSFADLHAIDLIIMGAFSHGRLHDLILGSTAAYIIRKSTIPILLHR